MIGRDFFLGLIVGVAVGVLFLWLVRRRGR